MTTPAISSVVRMLEKLPEPQQKQVVAHLRNYLSGSHAARPKGKKGKQVLKFAGVILQNDLGQIKKAIEAGCEQVDSDEW